MKIKVCGMKNPDNIRELSRLPIDLMGLIFYHKSPRFIGGLDPKALNVLPENIGRVGVFVNEELEKVKQAIEKYSLDYVQLHGKETPDYCAELKSAFPDIKIIKVFSIAQKSDLDQTNDYKEVADYFLFDTKTPQYGGSGKKFDWTVLDSYKADVPFFLSGGISEDDIEEIRRLNRPQLYGLDLNSKFETEPGRKDIQLLEKFIKQIKP